MFPVAKKLQESFASSREIFITWMYKIDRINSLRQSCTSCTAMLLLSFRAFRDFRGKKCSARRCHFLSCWQRFLATRNTKNSVLFVAKSHTLRTRSRTRLTPPHPQLQPDSFATSRLRVRHRFQQSSRQASSPRSVKKRDAARTPRLHDLFLRIERYFF